MKVEWLQTLEEKRWSHFFVNIGGLPQRVLGRKVHGSLRSATKKKGPFGGRYLVPGYDP